MGVGRFLEERSYERKCLHRQRPRRAVEGGEEMAFDDPAEETGASPGGSERIFELYHNCGADRALIVCASLGPTEGPSWRQEAHKVFHVGF